MGLLDTILGRSKPVRPDLDQLFGLPGAAITLQAAAGFAPTGVGSVCFASVEGGAFAGLQEEVRELLDADTGRGGIPVEFSQDAYGYTWLLARRPADDLPALVNDLHAVNTLLQEAGFGPQLLCSLIGFREAADSARWLWSTSTSAAPSTPSRHFPERPGGVTTHWSSRPGRCSRTT